MPNHSAVCTEKSFLYLAKAVTQPVMAFEFFANFSFPLSLGAEIQFNMSTAFRRMKPLFKNYGTDALINTLERRLGIF